MLVKDLTAANVNMYPEVQVLEIKETLAAKYKDLKFRDGIDRYIAVDGEVVKMASNDYGLLNNKQFFGQFEDLLNNAGINYSRRAVNNRNRSFKVDYILEDESFHLEVKSSHPKAKDVLKPMITAVNSYDGSQKTIGSFAGFRQVCTNGLHVATTQIGFGIRHRGNMLEVVMPKIEDLITQFMDNEFYSLHKKFDVLAEKPVPNIEQFVKYVLGKSGLAKYEKSEKNPDEPSKAAEHIIATITRESEQLGTKPNLWLGYNAFNEYIHNSNNKLFTLKEEADKKMFATIEEMANTNYR